ncbi:signal peptidase I [Clostridium sp. HV4-5-A1G]|uniref:signal peptidase I n=1 Tax=Clostridium sp. HV4-5-A1G TaxID=2004595 RepID=UPI001A9E8B72|nr:signal peptidase I [Clostridium sp. HV4-5-A1G]
MCIRDIYIIYILIIFGLAFILQSYVFSRVVVSGPSMQPTFNNNDVIFIEKVSTEIGYINRGEIIVFNSHRESNSNYIKRVIGIAGDKIRIKNSKVYLNGKLLSEDYLPKGTDTESNSINTEYIVPNGYVFVLGDNRGNSTDSRILGPISVRDITGHVVIRIYPFSEIKIF